MPRRSAAEAAVRSPRRHANQRRPSPGSRPVVRSPQQSSWRPTCPSVPGFRSSSSSQAHLTASARFRVRAPGPVSGRLCETAGGGASHSCPGFPLPFGHRRSLLGHPIPAGELGPPYGRLTGPKSGPRRGYHVAHAQVATGVGASCTPRAVVLSWPAHIASQRLPLYSGQPLHPVPASHQRGSE